MMNEMNNQISTDFQAENQGGNSMGQPPMNANIYDSMRAENKMRRYMGQSSMNGSQYNNFPPQNQNVGYMGQPPMNGNQYDSFQGQGYMGQPPMNGNQYDSFQGQGYMGQPPMNGNQYNDVPPQNQNVGYMGQPPMNGSQYNNFPPQNQNAGYMGQPPMNGSQYNNFLPQNQYDNSVKKNDRGDGADTIIGGTSEKKESVYHFENSRYVIYLGAYLVAIFMFFNLLFISGIVMLLGAVLTTPKILGLELGTYDSSDDMFESGKLLIIASIIRLVLLFTM